MLHQTAVISTPKCFNWKTRKPWMSPLNHEHIPLFCSVVVLAGRGLLTLWSKQARQISKIALLTDSWVRGGCVAVSCNSRLRAVLNEMLIQLVPTMHCTELQPQRLSQWTHRSHWFWRAGRKTHWLKYNSHLTNGYCSPGHRYNVCFSAEPKCMAQCKIK